MQGLFFDARYIRVGQHDGISRFSSGLLEALNKETALTAIVCDLRQLEKLPRGVNFVKLSRPTSILEPLIAYRLNKLGAKVVFSPMQTIGSMGRNFKLILTVHDLIYYQYPTPPPDFNLLIRALWRLYHLMFWPQRILLNRADGIVAVSETTKSLMSKNGLTKRPIWVVPNAADQHPNPMWSPNKALADFQRPIKKSLVYMGSFMNYKNVETLIDAMKYLPDYELLLLSRISPDRKVELLKRTPLKNRIQFINGVSDTEYLEYLDTATALVSASRDEGFGIPLVESMSRGIPIIVSNISIFREIGGSAARFFNPSSAEEFAAAVRQLEDQQNWSRASQQSLDQARKFSWDLSAQKLLKVLVEIGRA